MPAFNPNDRQYRRNQRLEKRRPPRMRRGRCLRYEHQRWCQPLTPPTRLIHPACASSQPKEESAEQKSPSQVPQVSSMPVPNEWLGNPAFMASQGKDSSARCVHRMPKRFQIEVDAILSGAHQTNRLAFVIADLELHQCFCLFDVNCCPIHGTSMHVLICSIT